MPTVIRYDDPRIVATAATGAGRFQQLRQQNADSVQQAQLRLAQQNADMNMANALEANAARARSLDLAETQAEFGRDLAVDQFNANQDQRAFSNNLAADAQQFAQQQALAAPQQRLQYMQDAGDIAQEQTAEELQAKVTRNLAALDELGKSGLKPDWAERARAIISQTGEDPLTVLGKLQGMAQKVNDAELERTRATQAGQGKAADPLRTAMSDYGWAVRVATQAKAERVEYRKKNTDEYDQFTGDPAEVARLDRAVDEAQAEVKRRMEAVTAIRAGRSLGSVAPAPQTEATAEALTKMGVAPEMAPSLAQNIADAKQDGLTPEERKLLAAQTLVACGYDKAKARQVWAAMGLDGGASPGEQRSRSTEATAQQIASQVGRTPQEVTAMLQQAAALKPPTKEELIRIAGGDKRVALAIAQALGL